MFGDLLDGANPAISNNTCDDQATAIPVGGSFTCTFDAALSGMAGDPDHENTVTANADDNDGNTATDDATETVAFTDTLPSISTTKTPSVGSLPEPGGTVTFSVSVTNTSVEPVTLTSLDDDVFGDLLDGGNPAITNNTCDDQPTGMAVGGDLLLLLRCRPRRRRLGGRPLQHGHRTCRRRRGQPAESSDDADVAFTDVLPTISVTKTPFGRFGRRTRWHGHLHGRGGQHLAGTDDADVTRRQTCSVTCWMVRNPAITNNTCDDESTAIGVGGTFTCTFDAALSGLAGDPDHVNTVTADSLTTTTATPQPATTMPRSSSETTCPPSRWRRRLRWVRSPNPVTR